MDPKKFKLSRGLKAKKEALKNEFSKKLLGRIEEIIQKDKRAVKKFFKARGAGVEEDTSGRHLKCATGKKSAEFDFSKFPHVFFGANFIYMVSIRSGKKTAYYYIVVIFDRSRTALKGGKDAIELKPPNGSIKQEKTGQKKKGQKKAADIDIKIQSIKKAVAELEEKITKFDRIFDKTSYSLRETADFGKTEIHKSKNLKELLPHIFK
ncbi:MAG: hypothetical protein L0Y79_13210 [Chlorobi bacterium]|nr:hypothetical protein [Chlorobiota bacterium]MCI0715701.1 hypothetical protein [Chlorobiota bacterium]